MSDLTDKKTLDESRLDTLMSAFLLILISCCLAFVSNLSAEEPVALLRGLGYSHGTTLAQAQDFFARQGAIFVDTRKPEKYRAGHIPGALNFPLGNFDQDYEKVEAILKQGKPVLVYCERGCGSAAGYRVQLKKKGHENLPPPFFAGFTAWSKTDLPVHYGEAP